MVSQHEGPGADHIPPIIIVAVLLDLPRGAVYGCYLHGGSDSAPRGLAVPAQNDRILVGGCYRIGTEFSESPDTERFGGFGEAAAQSQYTMKAPFDIFGSQLPSVHWWLVMPVNALPDFEDNSERVRLLPAFSQPALSRQSQGGAVC